ncbi:MAG: isoamylase early set domain-containing protein [Candidatus Krumholzibacteriota bacterium]|nr:isoamylase early set domain-containing protein [Candidatus Krumholzibacteriota bacterium]
MLVYKVMLKCKFFVFIVIISFASIIHGAGPPPEESAEITLRQQLISFFQSGSAVEEIPHNHILYPIRRIPVVATTAYLLMHQDPGMLQRFYPQITQLVMDRLGEKNTTPEGYLRNSPYPESADGVSISPEMNALANLELYSLSLIAARIGFYEDALELRAWSRNFSEALHRTFYDHSRDCFFPVSREGHYLTRYSPEQLLPLLIESKLSQTARGRIADRLVYNLSQGIWSSSEKKTLWNDPLYRGFVLTMLRNIPGLSLRKLEEISTGSWHLELYEQTIPAHRYWINFWSHNTSCGQVLFPTEGIISSLIHFTCLVDKESLFRESDLASLRSTIEKVKLSLRESKLDLDGFIESTNDVNRLLSRMSQLSEQIKKEEKLWKLLDENRWRELSPRNRKLIVESSVASLPELIRVKVYLSEKMMKSTGISASVELPGKPVPVGRKIVLEASLQSRKEPLEIERLYLQVAGNRWKITENEDTVSLAPDGAPFQWTKTLTLPPGSEPGIVALPLFFDFMYRGKRVEIHREESVTLTRGFDVSLNFPAGRRLQEESLPVHIILRYKPEQNAQGLVEGVFLEDLECVPELPARFELKKGEDITTLPLEIRPRQAMPPGRYPFSLSLRLGGKTIAAFEEELVRPMRWLHLGPLPQQQWVLDNILEFQDNLYRSFSAGGGREISWQEVPPGAVDVAGAVLPDRLYGSESDRYILLYTVLIAPRVTKATWRLKTLNTTSLWINSEPALSGHGAENSTGVITLRQGRNSILLLAGWKETPGAVRFGIGDQDDFPLYGIRNQVEDIFEGYAGLTGRTDRAGPALDANDQPREIVFFLDYPEADEVSLIGEFNNWSPEATPLAKQDNGDWSVTLILRPGSYPYKFLIDRKVKILDPSSSQTEPDGFGGLNSVMRVK